MISFKKGIKVWYAKNNKRYGTVGKPQYLILAIKFSVQ